MTWEEYKGRIDAHLCGGKVIEIIYPKVSGAYEVIRVDDENIIMLDREERRVVMTENHYNDYPGFFPEHTVIFAYETTYYDIMED